MLLCLSSQSYYDHFVPFHLKSDLINPMFSFVPRHPSYLRIEPHPLMVANQAIHDPCQTYPLDPKHCAPFSQLCVTVLCTKLLFPKSGPEGKVTETFA